MIISCFYNWHWWWWWCESMSEILCQTTKYFENVNYSRMKINWTTSTEVKLGCWMIWVLSKQNTRSRIFFFVFASQNSTFKFNATKKRRVESCGFISFVQMTLNENISRLLSMICSSCHWEKFPRSIIVAKNDDESRKNKIYRFTNKV